MKVVDFLDKIHATPFDNEKILIVLDEFLFSNEFQNHDDFCDDVTKFFEKVWTENNGEGYSSIGPKLDCCLQQCKSKEKNSDVLQDGPYGIALNKAENIISDLMKIYESIAQGHQKVRNKKDTEQESIESAIAQHEESLKEIKNRISELNTTVRDANKLIDDKVFTLLLNTVAILGIFVAIAFTGFGVVSVFSSINLNVSLTSTNAFIKNVFFLLLVALLSYNLLLLLVYFIFKLSRPIFPFIQPLKDNNTGDQCEEQIGFKSAVNLKPFLIIDAIMVGLVVLFFFLSIMPEISDFVTRAFVKQG